MTEGAGPEAPQPQAAQLAAKLAGEELFRIVRPYQVRFEESTPDETMRTSIHLAWVADIAWQHSTLLGFGRDWYTERGCIWLVRAVRLEILRPIHTYARVLVSTRVAGFRRVSSRRESEVRDESGEILARVEIDWVMTNGRGLPTRIPREMAAFVPGTGRAFEMHMLALPKPPAEATKHQFRVRRRDLDPLDHVNNSVYIDYFEQALEDAGQAGLIALLPRTYTVEYVGVAAHGERITGHVWPHEGGWAYLLTRDDGSPVLRATLKVASPASPTR